MAPTIEPKNAERALVRYHTPEGLRLAIVAGAGRSRLRVVVMDCPLKVRRVPAAESKYMQPIDYPLSKALKRFRAAGRALGLSTNARRFLRDAAP